MPWHIPDDLKYFKRITLGKPVIMGRKCYESLGKPLKGRLNIVMTRNPSSLNAPEEVLRVSSLDEALKEAVKTSPDEIMILGGAQVYKEALPCTERLYLTRIERDYEGDVLFPPLDLPEWETVAEERHEGDPPFVFTVLERKTRP